MYKEYLNTSCEIYEKTKIFKNGIQKEALQLIGQEPCRLTTPHTRDFEFIAKMINNKKQIWNLYLTKDSKIKENHIVKIDNQEYKVLYVYAVQGKNLIHHVKCIVQIYK